jgi:hypothetical protein
MFKRIAIADVCEIQLTDDALEFITKASSAMGAENMVLTSANTEIWAKFIDVNGDAFEQVVGTIQSGSLPDSQYTYPVKEMLPLLKRANSTVHMTDRGLLHLTVNGFSVYYAKKV